MLAPEQKLRDAPAILLREQRKSCRDRAWLSGRPRRALFEKLGPREAQEEHGTVDSLDHGIGQVEHRGLRPVDVLEHHDERLLGGDDLEQASDRPGCVGRERLANAEALGESVADGRTVGLIDKPLAERRRDLLGVSPGPSRCLREQLDERRERDADAVGGSLTDQDGRPFADLACERGSQT